jgi:ketosteroid isomerase-like protein
MGEPQRQPASGQIYVNRRRGELERKMREGLENLNQARRMEMSTDLEQMLRRVLVAFNEHDLDAIMSHLAEDCVFETPRGPDRWGRRFVGKEEVRRGLAARFEGIPDVHYGDDDTSLAATAASRSGRSAARPSTVSTSTSAAATFWAYAEGKIVRKNSFWNPRDAMSSAPFEGPSAEPATKETRWASWS